MMRRQFIKPTARKANRHVKKIISLQSGKQECITSHSTVGEKLKRLIIPSIGEDADQRDHWRIVAGTHRGVIWRYLVKPETSLGLKTLTSYHPTIPHSHLSPEKVTFVQETGTGTSTAMLFITMKIWKHPKNI